MIAWALAFGLAMVAFGCKNSDRTAQPAPSASARGVPQPVDELPEDGVVEGPSKAFGFPIPAKMSITTTERAMVVAAGAVPADDLREYVRNRILAATTEEVGHQVTFSRATCRENPERMLRIKVRETRRGASELTVWDTTQGPGEKEVTPEMHKQRSSVPSQLE